MKKIVSLLALLLFAVHLHVSSQPHKPFLVCKLHGPLGHQMFQVATAVALAKDRKVMALFPDLRKANRDQLTEHHKHIFSKLNASSPYTQPVKKYVETKVSYSPIPFQPNMCINGFFQCEKYFIHRKTVIQELFAPSSDILEYLQSHFGDIIADPISVAIHVQKNPSSQDKLHNLYAVHGRKYIQKAIDLFPDDYHFYVFSDDINWCIATLSDLSPHMRFVNCPSIYHALYLQSLCQHNIISNSSFAWWAAWLNKNPNKVVIAPKQWFVPNNQSNSNDIIPAGWYQLSY